MTQKTKIPALEFSPPSIFIGPKKKNSKNTVPNQSQRDKTWPCQGQVTNLYAVCSVFILLVRDLHALIIFIFLGMKMML